MTIEITPEKSETEMKHFFVASADDELKALKIPWKFSPSLFLKSNFSSFSSLAENKFGFYGRSEAINLHFAIAPRLMGALDNGNHEMHVKHAASTTRQK